MKCAGAWEQCGGLYYDGPTCCKEGYKCEYQNDYYSQCLSEPVNPHCAEKWAQCGGIGYHGPTCCQKGFECISSSDWFHQCLPKH